MSNHRKNSSFYHHGSSEPETEDFNFLASNNHEINGFMYENASSSDESQENNHGTLETEEIIQQNCAEINMKYIPKTMIKYVYIIIYKQKYKSFL